MRQFITHVAEHLMDDINQGINEEDNTWYTVTPRKCWNTEQWEEVLDTVMDEIISELNDSADGVEYSWKWEDNDGKYTITISWERDKNGPGNILVGNLKKPDDKLIPNADEWADNITEDK